MTDVDISSVSFKVAAVFLNENEYAYCKAGFDAESLDWFTDNLSEIENKLTQVAIR